jgi:hypothetical protein
LDKNQRPTIVVSANTREVARVLIQRWGIAVEALLSPEVNLRSRRDVKRALDRANAVPVALRRCRPAYEAFVSWCVKSAKAERA